MSSDPLSLLLGKKKEELSAKPPAPAAAPAPASTAGLFDLPDVASSRPAGRPAAMEARRDTGAALQGLFGPPSREPAAAGPGGGSPLAAAPPRPAPVAAPALVPAAATVGAAVGSGAGASPSKQAGGSTVTFEDILPGETVHVVVKGAFLLVANPFCEVSGRVLVTNYRVKFQTPKGTLREELRWMQDVKFFDVPIGIVEECKEEKSTTATGALEIKLKVTTKDFRVLCFLLPSEQDSRSFSEALVAFGAPADISRLFAFRHCEASRAAGAGVADAEDREGSRLFDPSEEYTRMGVDTDIIPSPSCPWRLSPINTDYSLCPSYPARVVLPRNMSDANIRAVAGFRKRGRLPAMSWCGGPELRHASLWRCAQTTEGLMGKACIEDQRLVEFIRRGSDVGHERDLLVMDLRPWKSAWANKAGGGGFEGYPRCKLVFGGIDNIHCVRDAWRAMGAAVNNIKEDEPGTWMKDVANSCWYDYMGAILSSTMKVVHEIFTYKSNVMIHCSDGWDRTAQVSSLAMICLDARYRTQAGFLRLIQKEWCSFGHKFRTRLAIGEQPTSEYSPVFIQWLDCVYQLVRQFPADFEFTPAVLLRLAHEVLTNRYGTFLTDNERERNTLASPHTMSLWSVLLRPCEAATWRNGGYQPRAGTQPLLPSVCQAHYAIWETYWFRYHPRGQKSRSAEAAAGGAHAELAAAAADGGALGPGTGWPAPPEAAPEPAAAPAPPARDPEPPAPPAEAAAAGPPPPLGSLGGLAAAGATLQQQRSAPRSLFADDDDEDVFAKHERRPAAVPAPAAAAPAPAPDAGAPAATGSGAAAPAGDAGAAPDAAAEAGFEVVGDPAVAPKGAPDEDLL